MEAMAERLDELSPHGNFLELLEQIKQKNQQSKQKYMRRRDHLHSIMSNVKIGAAMSPKAHPLGFHISATANAVMIDDDGNIMTQNQDNKMVLVPIMESTSNKSTEVTDKDIDVKKPIKTKDYASLVPLPVTKVSSVNAEMSQERLERQRLLMTFEQDIKQTER